MEQCVTVDIAVPLERVWEVLSNVESWPAWTPTVTSVRRLDAGPLRLGSRARISQPRLPETEYVVTELIPGRSFTWVAAGPGVLTTAPHDVEPRPGGGTSVRLSVSQAGWLGSVIGRFYRGLTDRYLANDQRTQGPMRGAGVRGRARRAAWLLKGERDAWRELPPVVPPSPTAPAWTWGVGVA